MARKLTGFEIVQRSIQVARERRMRALGMRNSGLTIQQVADKLGVSRQRAAMLIYRAQREAQTSTKTAAA